MVPTDEYMERLRKAVAGYFPLKDGETFHQYAERAKKEPFETRWFVSCAIENALDDLSAERQAQKTAWIAAARLKFSPGPRQACEICQKYKSLTEAHHIVPLGMQFDAGAIDPIQEFRWLCPTHHTAEHVIIAALMKTVQPDLEGMPIEERDALNFGSRATRFVDLFFALPRAHALSRSFRDAEAFLRGDDQ